MSKKVKRECDCHNHDRQVCDICQDAEVCETCGAEKALHSDEQWVYCHLPPHVRKPLADADSGESLVDQLLNLQPDAQVQ